MAHSTVRLPPIFRAEITFLMAKRSLTFLGQNLGIDSYGSLRIGIALEGGGQYNYGKRELILSFTRPLLYLNNVPAF